MIEHINFNMVYYELIKKLLCEPEFISKNRKGMEISEYINLEWKINDPKCCFATIRNMSLTYLKGELEFYMSGSPFLKDIRKHATFWDKVSDDGRSVNSNYGKLLLHDRNLNNYTQFEYARDALLNNSDSKKAVMVIYDKGNAFKSNDNPCTMFLQFFIRGKKLNLFTKMRSSDVWFGLPYDIPFFTLVQQLMLKSLKGFYQKLELGAYTHQAGSVHLYDRDYGKVDAIIQNEKDYEVTELHYNNLQIQHKLHEEIIKPILEGSKL